MPTFADQFNLRLPSANLNGVANAVDGILSQRWGGSSTGSATAYAVAVTPAPTAYFAGLTISFLPHASNTGACTVNLNSLGVRNVLSAGGNVGGGAFVANVMATLVYDGTSWHLVADARKSAVYSPGFSGDGTINYSLVSFDRADYAVDGPLAWANVSCVGSTSGAQSATLGVGLAIPAGSGNQPLNCAIQDGSGWRPAVAMILPASLSVVSVTKYDGSNWTLGAGRRITFSGWYKR